MTVINGSITYEADLEIAGKAVTELQEKEPSTPARELSKLFKQVMLSLGYKCKKGLGNSRIFYKD